MGTTIQKLSKVLNTKNEIKDILLSKGAIEETTPFGEYPAIICKLGGNSDKIANISLKRSTKIYIGILRDDSPQVINDNIVSVVAARQ